MSQWPSVAEETFPPAYQVPPVAGQVLEERRAQAREAFQRLPMPTWRRGRGWSLTPEPLDLSRYLPPADFPLPGTASPGEILWVDGVVTQAHMPKPVELYVGVPGQGISLPPEVQAQVGRVVAPDRDKLSALNLAALTSLVVVRVPRQATGPTTVTVRHRFSAVGRVSLPRLVVWLEEGASLDVFEDVEGPAGQDMPSLLVGVTEVYLGPGAHLRYGDVTQGGPGQRMVWVRRAHLERDSRLEWTSGVFGGAFVAAEWDTDLAGEGSQLSALGTYLPAGREQFSLTSRTWHRAPHTQARVEFRGAALGRSQSVFDGIVGADRQAKGTQAYLADHLLFLSRHARADSIPSLLIEGDDVQVGHGATIGRVDPQQVYYLGTRGLDPLTARRLLVMGYFEPTLARMPHGERAQAYRERLWARIEAHVGLGEEEEAEEEASGGEGE
jgi:Fe-S cluster assembly protein SufD